MRMKKFGTLFSAAAIAWTLGTTASFAQSNIEFIQWWEPELPQGFLRGIMDDFESKNPDIKVSLVSGPFATTRDQVSVGAASGTLSDVVGLDGSWVNSLYKQGAIASLDDLMDKAGYDRSQISTFVKVDGKSVMIPLVSAVYPIFVNMDIAKAAGVDAVPSTRSEFEAAAKKMTDASKNQYGWSLPLSLQTANGVQNDVISWVWASGGNILKDGKPDLENSGVTSALDYLQKLYKDGVISPGVFSKSEQDKVEEFASGRVGMIISPFVHANVIRDRNPNLKFEMAAVPAADDYTGKRGMAFASWGIGVNENSENKEAAWKLVEYLASPEVNAKIAAQANMIPVNRNAKPDSSDPVYAKALEIVNNGYMINEFVGAPVAEDLMRDFAIEMQKQFDGGQSTADTVANAQKAWSAKF
jgi:multiple sugar transport system substrate-binding protein